MIRNTEDRKDYMGVITWHKSSGPQESLFGSEIKTGTPITIAIHQATLERDCSTDRIYPDHRPIIEIELTPLQWAEFLTSGNNAAGVPCTIVQHDGKRMSKVEERNVADEFSLDMQESFNSFSSGVKNIENTVQTAIEKGSMSKRQLQDLLKQLRCFRENSVGNVKFIKDEFEAAMQSTVVKAKTEINSYIETKILETGMKSLALSSNIAEAKPNPDTDIEQTLLARLNEEIYQPAFDEVRSKTIDEVRSKTISNANEETIC